MGLGLKSANSTLTAHPDGHLAYTKNSTTSVDANMRRASAPGEGRVIIARDLPLTALRASSLGRDAMFFAAGGDRRHLDDSATLSESAGLRSSAANL